MKPMINRLHEMILRVLMDLLPESVFVYFETMERRIREKIPGCRESGEKWFRTTVDKTICLLLQWGITWLILCGLLYLSHMLWYVYIETPVGETFVKHYESIATPIFNVLNLHLYHFSFVISKTALKACLTIGAFCQLLSFTRFFYFYRGTVARVIFWGLVCNILVAHDLSREPMLSWRSAFVFGLIPSFFLTERSFQWTAQVFPEVGAFLRWLQLSGIRAWHEGLKRKPINVEDRFSSEHLNDMDSSY